MGLRRQRSRPGRSHAGDPDGAVARAAPVPRGVVAPHLRPAGGAQPLDHVRAAAAPLRRPARGGPAPRSGAARRGAIDRSTAPGPAVSRHPPASRGSAPGGHAAARGAVAARDRGAPGDERGQCRRPADASAKSAPRAARRGGRMSEPTPSRDWERWQALWRRAGNAGVVAQDAPQQIARARRGLLVARLVESAVAAAAILITAAALRHAGNPFEAALGLVVGASIGVLWIGRIRLRDREDTGVAGPRPRPLAGLRNRRSPVGGLAAFVWIVLPLELAFLTPWWVIGSRVHHRSLTDPGSWLTVWLPIVGMVALFVWSLRLRGRARAALRAIARLRDQFNSAERGE